jgi:hypothetical protein
VGSLGSAPSGGAGLGAGVGLGPQGRQGSGGASSMPPGPQAVAAAINGAPFLRELCIEVGAVNVG